MKKRNGLFIVLEGLDGSGTTTQAALLHNYFQGLDRPSRLTCEPTDGPVGKLIRDALSGRLTSSSTGDTVLFSERTRCLLFAADRLEHSQEIETFRSVGETVISDRYILSSIAYQALDESISSAWVIEVNRGCAVPDLTLFLDVPVSLCLKRLHKRKDRPTVYEKKSLLTAVDRNYRRTISIYEKRFGLFRSIDGTPSPKRVHEAILEAVEAELDR
jgi:dTMP kinase